MVDHPHPEVVEEEHRLRLFLRMVLAGVEDRAVVEVEHLLQQILQMGLVAVGAEDHLQQGVEAGDQKKVLKVDEEQAAEMPLLEEVQLLVHLHQTATY